MVWKCRFSFRFIKQVATIKATRATTAKKKIDLAGSMQDPPPSKKLKLQPKTGELLHLSSMASEGGDATSSLPNVLLPPSLPPRPPLSLQPSPWPSPPIVVYWQSPEVKKLFNLKQGETVLEALNNQIKKLQSTNKSSSAYLNVIQNVEEVNEEDITQYQKWRIQQKAQYLALVLNLAKENMNNWTWMKCCETAVKQLEQQDCTHAKNECTVMKWYWSFQETR